jgi:hypothetical protein
MRVFDFLLALYSIVAGLGMSIVVRSIAQMIEARQRIRLYWVHGVMIAFLFMAQIVSWFSLWQFAGHSPWTVADALFLLVIPLVLYLVGHLAVPELEDGLVHDLREYYYRHARWGHGLMLAVIVISLIGETFILGHLELTPPRMLRIALGVVFLPGILTVNPVVHSVQAALLVVVMAIGVSFVRIAIG